MKTGMGEWETGLQCRIHFATGNYVDMGSLLVGNLIHRNRRKGLASIANLVFNLVSFENPLKGANLVPDLTNIIRARSRLSQPPIIR